MWGRGQHGGGGFGCYKAIEHIDPKFLGLSVALFGPAWTWESEQDKAGWTWEAWWDYERKLWLGPQKAGEAVHVPNAPRREGEPECPHGKFEPLVSFFSRVPPPNPADLAFYTSFGVGVGRAWFVEGTKVLQTETGWTDVDKQSSLGDLLWPRPTLAWDGDERSEALPNAAVALNLADAWNGGNSLRLNVSGAGSDAEDAFFRCIWLPIQSLAITPRRTYEAHIVYKVDTSAQVDFDLGLSVKLLNDDAELPVHITPITASHCDLPGGWTTRSIQFEIQADHPKDILTAVGLVIGFATEDPTEAYKFSLLLGQVAVFPADPHSTSTHQPKILWADFKSSGGSKFSGVLTWEIASSFAPLANINITAPDDPNPVWILDTSTQWFPSFIYFNIYIQVPELGGNFPAPDKSIFIGTTGLDGRAQRFYVDPQCLPKSVGQAKSVRFLVQGVTGRGEVLKWEQCVFVNV